MAPWPPPLSYAYDNNDNNNNNNNNNRVAFQQSDFKLTLSSVAREGGVVKRLVVVPKSAFLGSSRTSLICTSLFLLSIFQSLK